MILASIDVYYILRKSVSVIHGFRSEIMLWVLRGIAKNNKEYKLTTEFVNLSANYYIYYYYLYKYQSL